MSSPSSRHLIVSLHDAHPGSWAAIEEQLDFLAKLGVPRCSVLLVPEFHHEQGGSAWDRTMVESLRARQDAGYELVLHGYYHDRIGQADTVRNFFWTRLYTSREAEFLDLPDAEAEARIRRGLDLFQQNGWQAKGFIAPAWLMSPGLPALLQRMGFRYTNRLREILPFGDHAVTPPPILSQSLCYSTRAVWRRFASLRWNRLLYSRLRRTPLMRLSLHPNDLKYLWIRLQIQNIVKSALHEGFQPTTYADYVAR